MKNDLTDHGGSQQVILAKLFLAHFEKYFILKCYHYEDAKYDLESKNIVILVLLLPSFPNAHLQYPRPHQ